MKDCQEIKFNAKKFIRILLATISVCLTMIFNVDFSKAFAEENSDDQGTVAASSENVNAVLSGIYSVAQHGDLADASFFAKAIGLKMNQLPDRNALFSFEICGVPEDPDPVENSPSKLRRYQYANVPSFLKKPVEHPNSCSADYVERLDDQGRVSKVMAKLEFDMKDVCITASDIEKSFPNVRRDARSTPKMFLYDYRDKSGMDIYFISSQKNSFSACIETAMLTQSF
ncbi:hypothetical protein [Paraburkholderia phenazinium]|uniref:Uncharacterized protein n=1 Tax=Paraburkholderia phenazinium TaxID=60549 RepID=A0A1N6KYB1_9BURK|nr:hypothetical protein [Paraburkholderia phenazinium]SIO61500.1 hypothetical protein SAMN05444165_5253 [Paraburkholderia phenazinium]